MTTKLTRRKFLLTAAAALSGALTAGIDTLAPHASAGEAETPVPAEDIQAVPLGTGYVMVVDWADGLDATRYALVYRSLPTYESRCGLPIRLTFQ